MPGPRVTVAIPTYNRAAWLREGAESVLAQTFGELELVIADDGSPDETPAVVAELAASDPRVRSIRHASNVGVIENFESGARAAGGEYVLFLNDDDVLRREHLERAVRVLDENPRVGFVHTAFDVVGPAGEVVGSRIDWTQGLTEDTIETGAEFLDRSMLYSCRVCISTALVRRAAVEGRFFREQDFPAFDFGLWLRIATGWDVAFLADALGAYRLHTDTLTAANIGEPGAEGYLHGPDHLLWLRGFKQRFLDEHADRLPDAARMRQEAERASIRDLVGSVRLRTLPERRRLDTLRGLRDVSRLDRRVLVDHTAWKLVAASMVGPRLTERIKRASGR